MREKEGNTPMQTETQIRGTVSRRRGNANVGFADLNSNGEKINLVFWPKNQTVWKTMAGLEDNATVAVTGKHQVNPQSKEDQFAVASVFVVTPSRDTSEDDVADNSIWHEDAEASTAADYGDVLTREIASDGGVRTEYQSGVITLSSPTADELVVILADAMPYKPEKLPNWVYATNGRVYDKSKNTTLPAFF